MAGTHIREEEKVATGHISCFCTDICLVASPVNATYLFAENCTSSHSGCETVWNTDVRLLHRDLMAGTLSRHRLQSLCRS